MAGKLNFRHKGQEAIDPTLAAILAQAGEKYGLDLGITSGYRSPAYNASVGGAKKSYHMHGKAADLDMSGWSPQMRADMVNYLAGQGAGGFITYDKDPNMMHIDLRPKQGDKPLFMHNKSARYMDAAPEWFRNVASNYVPVPAASAATAMLPADTPPTVTPTGKFDLLGEVMNAAPGKPLPPVGGMNTSYNGRVFSLTPRNVQSHGVVAPVPPPAPAAPVAMASAAPAPAPGGIASGLGGILSGIASAITAGSQANAEANARAQAEWEQQYARTLGPSPAQMAAQMPAEAPRPQPDMPVAALARQQAAPIKTKDDILAELFGGAARPSRSVMG